MYHFCSLCLVWMSSVSCHMVSLRSGVLHHTGKYTSAAFTGATSYCRTSTSDTWCTMRARRARSRRRLPRTVSACPVSRWSTQRGTWVSVRGGGICQGCIGPVTCVRGASRFRSPVFLFNTSCLCCSFYILPCRDEGREECNSGAVAAARAAGIAPYASRRSTRPGLWERARAGTWRRPRRVSSASRRTSADWESARASGSRACSGYVLCWARWSCARGACGEDAAAVSGASRLQRGLCSDCWGESGVAEVFRG